jgi:TfoX/Sxy family transcriptional regulator of competence genes
MATNKNFIDFVCEQISSVQDISYRKMFGEYMVYCKGKPVLLVCDDTAFVKYLPEVKDLFEGNEKELKTGFPYKGAKEHYILDIDDSDFSLKVVKLLAEILPILKKKTKKK